MAADCYAYPTAGHLRPDLADLLAEQDEPDACALITTAQLAAIHRLIAAVRRQLPRVPPDVRRPLRAALDEVAQA